MGQTMNSVWLLTLPLVARCVSSTPLGRLEPRQEAASYAGAHTSDVYPPEGTTVDTALFPSKTVIGFPAVTGIGAEALAIETAPAYPANTQAYSPLVRTSAKDSKKSDDFDIFKHQGVLSPYASLDPGVFGLPDASPLIPEGDELTQIHLFYRHGARYPTALQYSISDKLQEAVQNGGFEASGDLKFLNTWSYKLGNNLLSPYGRQQLFDLGVKFRMFYGHLLTNFTEQGTLPVFRTESQDRMVNSALAFSAGMFGIPDYQTSVNIEIMVEQLGFNSSGAPYNSCPNHFSLSNPFSNQLRTNYSNKVFVSTAERLQPMLEGVKLNATDVLGMMELCAFETVSLGYSAFCSVFTEEDWRNYEYGWDINYYYGFGFGSPTTAAQGKGFLEETVARLTQTPLTKWDSSTNSTLDGNPIYFPLNQSIYADATHEVTILSLMTAFNLTQLFSSGPMPIDYRPKHQSFVASQVLPFATNFLLQVVERPEKEKSKQIRFIINDAVIPIADSYPGCSYDKDGFCAVETVVAALKKRIAEIDFEYDCYGKYNITTGIDYNGRAPRNN